MKKIFKCIVESARDLEKMKSHLKFRQEAVSNSYLRRFIEMSAQSRAGTPMVQMCCGISDMICRKNKVV